MFQTAQMKPLQETNTTSLALLSLNNKALGDGFVYIMFDAGNGPRIENRQCQPTPLTHEQ